MGRLTEETRMKFRINVEAKLWINNSGWSHSSPYDSWEEEWNSVNEMEEFYEKKFDWDEFMDFNNWDNENIARSANPEECDTYFELTATEIDENGDDIYDEDGDEIIYDLTGKWLSDIALTYCELMGIDTDIE